MAISPSRKLADVLSRCEFGKTDYNLNIVHPPLYDDEWDEEDCDE